jgi:LPS sulfotransferase NodH
MNRFVIFAHPRSGSTSLAKVLAGSKDVKMCIEPFNEDYSKWDNNNRNYKKYVKSTEKLDKALIEIFKKYSAIKCLDYQLPKRLYYQLLKKNDLKIVFLKRKNLGAAALSNAVAEQTKEWRKVKNIDIYSNLKPIKVSKLEKWINYVGNLSETYLSFLENRRKGDFLLLYYEDLYSDSFKINKQNILKICKYLEISPPGDNIIKKHMTPPKVKINYSNIYSKIPNYSDISSKFKL